MFCKRCGAQIDDNAKTCPFCGESQSSSNAPAPSSANPVDSGSIGWGILGFCIPIVGLILFLVWKDQKPKTAKVAGIGALVSVIIGVVFYILMFAIGIGSAMMMY